MIDTKDILPPKNNEGPSTGSWWGWILAAYWIALFTATHLPPRVPILPGGTNDKLAHLAAYAILAFLIACYWQVSTGWLGREHLLWIVVGCSLFGVVDELLQMPVGRYASVADWVADTLGALFGVFAFVVLRSIGIATRSRSQ
ncbi:MAG: VanZ family protein [Pirellulales bacterium]